MGPEGYDRCRLLIIGDMNRFTSNSLSRKFVTRWLLLSQSVGSVASQPTIRHRLNSDTNDQAALRATFGDRLRVQQTTWHRGGLLAIASWQWQTKVVVANRRGRCEWFIGCWHRRCHVACYRDLMALRWRCQFAHRQHNEQQQQYSDQ